MSNETPTPRTDGVSKVCSDPRLSEPQKLGLWFQNCKLMETDLVAANARIAELEKELSDLDALTTQLEQEKKTCAADNVRKEQCCECGELVSDWVEASHKDGRICRECEAKVANAAADPSSDAATPESDAAQRWADSKYLVVDVKLSRKLERQRDALQKRVEELSTKVAMAGKLQGLTEDNLAKAHERADAYESPDGPANGTKDQVGESSMTARYKLLSDLRAATGQAVSLDHVPDGDLLSALLKVQNAAKRAGGRDA